MSGRAGVVELVDTPALGAGAARRGGSSPSARISSRRATPPATSGASVDVPRALGSPPGVEQAQLGRRALSLPAGAEGAVVLPLLGEADRQCRRVARGAGGVLAGDQLGEREQREQALA